MSEQTFAMVNGKDSLSVFVALPLGWFVDFGNSAYTLASNFQVGTDGRPTLDADFNTTNVAELNTWRYYVHRDSIDMDANNCFAAALRLAVVRRNFLGAIDNNSRRFLWAYNDSTQTGVGPAVPGNPYLTQWCWAECAPPTPGGPYPIDSCALVADLPTYTCAAVQPVEFCTYNLDLRYNQTFNIRDYLRYQNGGGNTVDYNQVFFTYTEVGADDPTTPADWHLADFNAGTPVTTLSSDYGSNKGNRGPGEYRIYVYRQGQTTYDDHMTIRLRNSSSSNLNSAKCSNQSSGSCGSGNTITSTTTRCISTSGNLGTVSFSGNGKLVIQPGVNATASISASNGGTVIVLGTLTLTGSANYGGNFNIYVAEGGSLIRSGNITANSVNADIVNHGAVTISGNLTTGGTIGNTGTFNVNNLSLNGNGKLYNSGVFEAAQAITTACSSNNYGGGYGGGCGGGNNGPVSCDNLIHNCGRITAGTTLTVGQGTTLRNFCTVVAQGTLNLNGSMDNHAIAVGGNSTVGGFNHNGTLSLHEGAVVVAGRFNWGASRAISLDGTSWIIASTSTLDASGSVGTLGTTGLLLLNSGANTTGAGELILVDADLYGTDDLPTGQGAAADQSVSAGSGTSVTARKSFPATDVPLPCGGPSSI